MKKVKIPCRFTLNHKQIIVEFDNEYCNDNSVYGEVDFINGVITISDTFQGSKLPQHTIDTTFFHELAHLLLDAMGEEKLKYNEKFVDKLGMALYEYEISKKGRLDPP